MCVHRSLVLQYPTSMTAPPLVPQPFHCALRATSIKQHYQCYSPSRIIAAPFLFLLSLFFSLRSTPLFLGYLVYLPASTFTSSTITYATRTHIYVDVPKTLYYSGLVWCSYLMFHLLNQFIYPPRLFNTYN